MRRPSLRAPDGVVHGFRDHYLNPFRRTVWWQTTCRMEFVKMTETDEQVTCIACLVEQGET